jgi:hypothetical protein
MTNDHKAGNRPPRTKKTVRQVIEGAGFVGTSNSVTDRYDPEPVAFHDELEALEMTSSACAVPARFVE